MPVSIYEQLVALQAAEQSCVLVTLVEARGSVPQQAGAKMVVTENGLAGGTVGGGRIEAQAIELAQEMLRSRNGTPAPPQLVSWTLKGDVGMTCGGAVRLYFEPHLRGGSAWTIAIFGAGHVAQALVPVLAPLRCGIRCYDTRPEWIARLPAFPSLRTECRPDLPPVIDSLPPDSFVLCMTQGHRTDRPILHRALTTRRFPFVGVIGSASKAEVLKRDLRADGVADALLDTIHCPVGLPFGGNEPAEIALSIAAQLLAERDRLAAERAALDGGPPAGSHPAPGRQTAPAPSA